jgi:hypothetical protein
MGSHSVIPSTKPRIKAFNISINIKQKPPRICMLNPRTTFYHTFSGFTIKYIETAKQRIEV